MTQAPLGRFPPEPLADLIECKSPPSNKTIVHSSVRPGETYSSHREVRNRVPENIVDGNYFLIRPSISRLKLRSTIRGLSRSYLVYLPHECNAYNTHERSRGPLTSQFDVNFVGLLRTQIRVDFTLHTRWGRERWGFRFVPTFMREILGICGKKSISAGSLTK